MCPLRMYCNLTTHTHTHTNPPITTQENLLLPDLLQSPWNITLRCSHQFLGFIFFRLPTLTLSFHRIVNWILKGQHKRNSLFIIIIIIDMTGRRWRIPHCLKTSFKWDNREKFCVIKQWEKIAVSHGFAACEQCNKGFAFDSQKIGTLSPRKRAEGCRSTAAAVKTKRLFSRAQLSKATCLTAAHSPGRGF